MLIEHFKQKKNCPYCGNVLEWGAIGGSIALMWFSNPRRDWRGIKSDSCERITKFWGPLIKYGYKCTKCQLLILDLREAKEIEELE